MKRIFDPIDREFQVAEWRVHQTLQQAEQRRMIAQAFLGEPKTEAGGNIWKLAQHWRLRIKTLGAAFPRLVRRRSAAVDSGVAN